jgi:hypothetical protein
VWPTALRSHWRLWLCLLLVQLDTVGPRTVRNALAFTCPGQGGMVNGREAMLVVCHSQCV